MAATECIIQRQAGYTVMSNHHLRDKRLGLKAKGLLSVILSLPEDWDYTISGLAVICDVGKDAIRAAIRELEQTGYISRTQGKSEAGQFGGNQYIIREFPEEVAPPLSVFPTTVNPTTEKPSTDSPSPENPTEIITNPVITDEKNPPVSPKKPRKAKTTLDEQQMEALIRQNVATLGEANGWSRDGKNNVYKLVMEFYSPRAIDGKPPKHTARGVNGLFRKLAPGGKCNASTAAEMLLEAIERGWTSVYPREERKGTPSAPPRSAERLGEEW